MYDAISPIYDRFVNWQNRLAYELPFIEQHMNLLSSRVSRKLCILDSACGTGMHAIALAQMGHEVVGTDLSPEMIAIAERNAAKSGLSIRFEVVGLGEQTARFGEQRFDLVMCLGNSLPHLLTEEEVQKALLDFYQLLRRGGMVIIQNQNFDRIMQTHQREMEPQSVREGEQEWLFLRFYDFLENGLIRFNFLSLFRHGESPWQQAWQTSLLRPLFAAEVVQWLEQVGFSMVDVYGSLAGEVFDPAQSPNLVVIASNR